MKSQLHAETRHAVPGASANDGAQWHAAPANAPSEPSLPPALRGERITFGGLSCYVAGNGPPLVLVHSINAASSAAELRPIYDQYSATRTVFAIDLPGFGHSDRSDRRYDPRLMTNALHALADQVRNCCGATPIDALALSLGCEFLARAAVEQPARWGRLAFVSPTGLSGTKPLRGQPGSTQAKPWLHALLSAEPWSGALYRGLTKPAVLRYFLQRTWCSPFIDETLWAYDVLTARQPGARFAPLHFLSGGLFSQDIHQIYEAVSQPVWMSRGALSDSKEFSGKCLVRAQGNWRTTVFQTGSMAHFQTPSGFFREFDAFLDGKSSLRRAAIPMRAGRAAAPA